MPASAAEPSLSPSTAPSNDVLPPQREEPPGLACAVCLEDYHDLIAATGDVNIVVFTQCKHMFCTSCYYGMKTNRCPLCRCEGSAAHFTVSIGARSE